MTTPQNRQPKGINTGGQFAADTHAESTLLLDPAHREVILSPGDGDTFPELADGDVIETLNVSRSEDGSGYFVSPAKTVNIKDLIADSDPRLHGETLDSWLETNSPVIEDFLAERYQANLTTDEGWEEIGVECTAQLPEGPLSEARVVDAAWNGTKIVQLHNESDHGSFGSENLGRLIIERVNGSTVLVDPYAARAAGLRIDPAELDTTLTTGSPVSDASAVAIAKQLGNLRNTRGVIAYPAVGRLATRGYVDTTAVDLELGRIQTANDQAIHPDPQLKRRVEAMQSWIHGHTA
ncbi:hypothetical protein [Arthrobacter sp. UYCo732]|uniref:hypothetical protein n=1 Tax=Arthrobacter sp. UYCo732 TaxID=3156336 RepID=UPI003394D75C